MDIDKKNASILYIDDEEANLRIFKINFRRYYTVFTTTQIGEAREILKNNPISLIITDQKMPEMTGTEFLKSIIHLYPNTIRIVLTGFSDIQDIIQAINDCKIYQYVTKPYENGEMKAIIDKALESYWADQERKSLLEQLKEANEKLEEKVAERTYELELTNRKLTDSIAYARKIQKSVLPEEQVFEKYFKDTFLLYKPKDVVGGDFYTLYDKGDKIIVAVGDCTGHGVPGALMSMLGSSLLSSIIDYKEDHRPDLILDFIREGVVKNLRQDDNFNKDGMELGIIAYHPEKKLLEFAGSRINLLYFQERQMYELKGDKKAIGGFDENEFRFSLQTLPIAKETQIYMFSDGFQDQFGGENNRKIGSKQLKELIKTIHQKPMYEQKVLLEVFLRDWMNKQPNNEQMDDIVVLGLKIS